MNNSTRIIAIRHGETAWNAETRLQGHLDIPLNDTGRWQAAQLAKALAARYAENELAAIYSSDLQRAFQTAQAIQHATGAPLEKHPGLRERGFGLFEGLTYAEVEARWPADSTLWKNRDPHWHPPANAQGVSGESLAQVRERLTHTLNELASRHTGQLIALVAHGGVMDQFYRLATQQGFDTPRTWQLGNTAVNRLLWTPEGLSLVGWADVSHLEGAAPSKDDFSVRL